ncbi:SLC13 family permease [Hutsoniella sourekii]
MILTIMGLLMIMCFVYLLLSQKLTVFGSLIIIPLIFGLLTVVIGGYQLSDLFSWIFEGVFFSIDNSTGQLNIGVAPAVFLILFAIVYFNLMLDIGLFDPIICFFIKQMKSDPLRVTVLTVLTSIAVSSTGDTTTTVIILLAAFVDLYRQYKVRLWMLAILIIGPNTILNMLPWGGPAAVISSAVKIDLVDLSNALWPGILLALVYCVGLGVYFGLQERKRLNYHSADFQRLDKSQEEQMIMSVRNRKKELKKPKYFWFNLCWTIFVLGLIISGTTHGSIAFLIGTIVAMTINFKNTKEINQLIGRYIGDAMLPPLATLGAGVFSGILNGSGMSAALASGATAIMPSFLGSQIILIYCFITIFGLVFLPQEAYYFGISSVMAEIMEQFGISRVQTAVASMMPQAFGMISPIIPALYILTDRTEQDFLTYQKRYITYLWPIFLVFVIVYTLTGAFPIM